MRIEDIERAYIACALWSSIDDVQEPLDVKYDATDIAPMSLLRMRADVEAFVKEASELLVGLDESQIGHDFWLTRNGHGAGFWDRGLGANGDKLSAICSRMKGCDLYLGDDRMLHVQ